LPAEPVNCSATWKGWDKKRWIYEHQKELKVPLAIGVGGSFDVISGRIPRAPQTWQKLNLEWLYRTLKEPRRLKRTLRLPLFVSSIYFKK